MKTYLIIVHDNIWSVRYVVGNEEDVTYLSMIENWMIYVSVDELRELYNVAQKFKSLFTAYEHYCCDDFLSYELIEKISEGGFGSLTKNEISDIHAFLYNILFKYKKYFGKNRPEICRKLKERVQ